MPLPILRIKNLSVESGAWGGSSPLSPRQLCEPPLQTGQDPSLSFRQELLEPGTGPRGRVRWGSQF